MTDPATAERVAPALAARIEATRKLLDELYDQRRECITILRADGRSQASIARLFRVSPMAVALASKPKKGEEDSTVTA